MMRETCRAFPQKCEDILEVEGDSALTSSSSASSAAQPSNVPIDGSSVTPIVVDVDLPPHAQGKQHTQAKSAQPADDVARDLQASSAAKLSNESLLALGRSEHPISSSHTAIPPGTDGGRPHIGTAGEHERALSGAPLGRAGGGITNSTGGSSRSSAEPARATLQTHPPAALRGPGTQPSINGGDSKVQSRQTSPGWAGHVDVKGHNGCLLPPVSAQPSRAASGVNGDNSGG